MKRLALVLSLSLVFGFGAVPAFSAEMSNAKVLSMEGPALYMPSGSADWKPLTKETKLSEGDKIKTGPASKVDLELVGNAKTAELKVSPDTEFLLQTFRHDHPTATDTTLLNVSMGIVLVKAEKLAGESKFEVKTPTSLIGIRGTTFEVKVGKKAKTA